MAETTSAWPIDVTTPEAAQASFAPLAERWVGADVVGLGWTSRVLHESHVAAHGLVRALVEGSGFRSVFVEGDWEASRVLDTFLRDGVGDPRRTLAAARPFLASEEMLDLVLWLRRFNAGLGAGSDDGDRVRLVHGGADDVSSPAALERGLAGEILAWHDQFGERLVYVGGVAHVAVASRRTYDPAVMPGPSATEPSTSAGGHLRQQLGQGYQAVGLTFGAAQGLQPVPPAAPGFVEAELDRLPYPTTAITAGALADQLGPAARPDRGRVVGPRYDPSDDRHHAMHGNAAEWFDIFVHQKVASPVTLLG